MATRRRASGDAGAAPSSSTQGVGQAGRPQIPMLNSVAPSIFTPIPSGMFDFVNQPNPDPDDSLRSRVDRLRHILEKIDYQRAGVRENMLYMFDREKQRIIQEAEDAEAAAAKGLVPQADVSLPYDQADNLIAAMEAPMMPGTGYNNYNVTNEEIHHMGMALRAQGVLGTTARDRAMESLFLVMQGALENLSGYDAHVMDIRRLFAANLEREKVLEIEAGLRPEERVYNR